MPIALFSKIVDFLLRHKRLFLFIIVVFFLIVGISTLCRGGIGPPPARTDLTVFLRGAEAVKSGENLYGVTNDRGWRYVYLPLLAILLTPFTHIPLLLNTSLWYALSIASLCGAIFLSAGMARDRPAGMRSAVMAGIFCAPTLVESMTRGQLGVITLFLAIAVLYLYIKGRPIWAGILFAFAVVLKSSPLAPLLIFFLVKKEWKLCVSALIGIFFFAFALPSLTMGIRHNWSSLLELNRLLSHAISTDGNKSILWSQLATPLAWDNQSLYAVFVRWPWPTETEFAANSDFWVRWGVRAFGVASLAALAFISRKKNTRSPAERIMLEYGLFLCLAILASPVTEIHHYAIFFALFLPVFLYLDKMARSSIFYHTLAWTSLIAGITQIMCYIRPFGQWGLPAVGALLFWYASFVFLVRQKT